MTFRDDALLALLALVPVAAALFGLAARARRVRTQKFGEPRTLDGLVVPPGGKSARIVRAGLFVFALAAASVALAGPRFGGRTRLLRKRGIDIVLAVDFSKSMLARDVAPNRIARAQREIRDFLSHLDGDRVGVVAFAGDTMEFPLTTDYAAIGLFLRDLGPYDMPVGGTAIGRALVASKRLLERGKGGSDRTRVVVLLTDGEDHEGDPLSAAAELKSIGARVYTVGIGTAKGEPIPTYSSDGTPTGHLRDEDGHVVTTALTADAEGVLRDIAKSTGGNYVHARRGTVGLDAVRRSVRALKQSELKARRVTVYEERYALFLLPAFLALVLEALLPERWPRARRPRPGRRSATPSSLALAALAFIASTFMTNVARAQWFDLFRRENPDVRAGNEALGRNDPAAALAHYDRAVRALPSRGAVHLDRGLALEAQGQHAEARAAFVRATEPPAGREVRADAYHDLGVSFFTEAEAKAASDDHASASALFKEAADAFRRSLRTRPGSADTAWNYELARRRADEEREAQRQRDQQNQDQQNQDPQNQDQQSQDQQNQDQQNQDQQNQDQQNQDPQNQDPQNQDQQNQDQQNQDQQNQDPQNQGAARQDAQTDQPPTDDPRPPAAQQGQADPAPRPDRGSDSREPATSPAESNDRAPDDGPAALPPEAARLLDSLERAEDNLERHRARLRAARERRRPEKDW